MTAREFKTRLAAGDKLAVVMKALWERLENEGCEVSDKAIIRAMDSLHNSLRWRYRDHAAHILAALASAGVKK